MEAVIGWRETGQTVGRVWEIKGRGSAVGVGEANMH